MIAIPVKTDKEEGVVAPLFGKARYFSIIDEQGNSAVHENHAEGGMKVVRWLERLGVKVVILNHLGEKPFHALLGHAIAIYYAGNERILVKDVVKKFHNGALKEVNITNYMELLGTEEHHHEHHHEEHHHGACCGTHRH